VETDTESIKLGVNVDHVATLRQARGTEYPNLVDAALLAEEAGADGITVHLREDRRHIQDSDVYQLKKEITTRLNLEMAVTEEMIEIAREVKPYYCCLVPEKREELTTEGGLDVRIQKKRVKSAVDRLTDAGIQCSLFIDPDKEQIDSSIEVGAPIVELHTGAYAEADSTELEEQELERVVNAIEYAHQVGLQVNAGHGLNYKNIKPIANRKELNELNIGHAIICYSVFVGLKKAVEEMKYLMDEARRN